MSVRIVDIGLIVEHHCPYFLFIIWKIYPILGYCEITSIRASQFLWFVQ